MGRHLLIYFGTSSQPFPTFATVLFRDHFGMLKLQICSGISKKRLNHVNWVLDYTQDTKWLQSQGWDILKESR